MKYFSSLRMVETDALPMVSVVVPTYQHAAFIGQCLDSILMQRTSFPIEVLVGEDESSDGTREICQRYAAEHPDRIRLFLRSRKEVIHINGKPTGRSNLLKLFAAARGKYIAWCDGDDYWTDPLKLAKQVALLEGDPVCMGSYHNTKIFDDHITNMAGLFREHLSDRMVLEDLIDTRSPFHPSSFLVRSQPFLKDPPEWTRKTPSLDISLFPSCIGSGTYRKAEGVMSAYRKHGGGITQLALHTGTSFHQNRILLWLVMDRYLGYRHTQRCQVVMVQHWKHIVQQCTPRSRFRYLWQQLRTVPTWFLRYPTVLLVRLREALQREV
jgi:glycosyltransferase involved in cell wall biosynthesis